jgi:prephenate dehydratase
VEKEKKKNKNNSKTRFIALKKKKKKKSTQKHLNAINYYVKKLTFLNFKQVYQQQHV